MCITVPPSSFVFTPEENSQINYIFSLFSPHRTHFQDLCILPVNTLFINRLGITMYTLLNDLLPAVMNELFVKKQWNMTQEVTIFGEYHGVVNILLTWVPGYGMFW